MVPDLLAGILLPDRQQAPVGAGHKGHFVILAAGDLNMFYGATRSRLALPERDRTVWERMDALGLEFLGRRLRMAAWATDHRPRRC